jgi:hypothetical protein
MRTEVDPVSVKSEINPAVQDFLVTNKELGLILGIQNTTEPHSEAQVIVVGTLVRIAVKEETGAKTETQSRTVMNSDGKFQAIQDRIQKVVILDRGTKTKTNTPETTGITEK